jgi:hypothetical protein
LVPERVCDDVIQRARDAKLELKLFIIAGLAEEAVRYMRVIEKRSLSLKPSEVYFYR